jgi:hypothetical protein
MRLEKIPIGYMLNISKREHEMLEMQVIQDI